jgi:hypothetical protein
LNDFLLGGVAAAMWLVDGRDLVRPMSISDVLAALELACDPEVFPLETGLVQAIGNALCDQVLVLVSWVTVDVPVANLDRP